MEGQARARRPVIDVETSRRTFLKSAAAAGVGVAMAALWEPSRVGKIRSALAAVAPPPPRLSAATVRADAGSDAYWMAHLLRRAGFSATGADVAAYTPLGIPAAVDQLLNYQGTTDPAVDLANNAGFDLSKVADAQRWWLTRMLNTNRPLQEKSTLFLHGILTSGVSKVGGRYLNTLIAQNEFLRANATGSYSTLLKGISRDPAMMVWLDLQTSTKAHPNENFARELQELFSLGIGHYSEDDVREAARAFTGYALDKDRHFIYNKAQHDDGTKSYLGSTGNYSGDDIIDIILQQRNAAEHIAGRLWSFYGYPSPGSDVISPLADTLQSSQFNLGTTLRQLFNMPQFYSDTAVAALIKSPVDFVVGAVRNTGVLSNVSTLPGYLQQMGQVLFDPPNVAGWPGGESWMSSSNFFARMNFLNSFIYAKGGPDPASVLGDYASLDPTSATALAASQLLSMPLSDASTSTIVQYLSDSNGGTAAVTDKNVKGFMYLVLGSPENQLI